MDTSTQKQLRQYVEQVEALLAEIDEGKQEVKDKFAEMKSAGFDVKIIRKIIARRKRSKAEVQEEDALLETYMSALGMKGTPMGDYMEREEAHA